MGRRHKVKLPDKQAITSVKNLSTDSHHTHYEWAAVQRSLSEPALRTTLCFPSDVGRMAFPTLNNINQERPPLGSQGLGSLRALQNVRGLGAGLWSRLLSFELHG